MTKFIINAGRKLGNGRSNGGKQQPKNKGELRTRKRARKSNKNEALSFFTARMMIDRLLAIDRLEKKFIDGMVDKIESRCTKYTKAELSQKLGLFPEELDKLESPYFYNDMINKVALPLIKLYCATKFATGEYRREK